LKTTEGIVEELESKLNQCQKRQTIKKKQTVKFKFFLQTLFNNNLVRKLPFLVPLIIIAVAIGAIGLAFVPSGIKNKRLDFAQGTAMINGNLIKVEIAKSAAEKQRWLMFRQERLPLNSAMMLIYDKLDLYAIWLLNIEYNLDLIWFDENGNIVYMVKDASPCKNTLDASNCTYKNTKPAKYVIAAASGFIDEHKITRDSKMTIISI
jgi:uncharacterized membrane protein (UPF0127 family)